MTVHTPKSLIEAVRYFADPKVCHDYMMRIKFPNGEVCCPECGSTNVGTVIRTVSSKSKKTPGRKFQRFILQCNNTECRNQFSAKTGTIFEDSALPLDMWFVAVCSITNAKNGISSCEIARALAITQKSAWHMLHRVRCAMKSGTFQKMSGTVEADESYIGGKTGNMKKSKLKALRDEYKKPGKPSNLAGRRMLNKSIVMGLLERGRDGDHVNGDGEEA